MTPRRALGARRTLAFGLAVAAAPTVAIAPTSSTAPGVIAVAALTGVADQRVVADARRGPVSVTRLRPSPVRAPGAVGPAMSPATRIPPGSHRPMPPGRPTVRVRVDEPDVAVRPRAGP